jgi:phage shock protein A
MGILEEDEEDDELLDFDEEGFEEFKEAVAQDIDELSDADAAMERRIAKLEEKVATLEELYRLLEDRKKKTASSNKK